VLDADPARADNCGSLSDCLPSAQSLLAALAGVLILVGLVGFLIGGASLLAALFEGGALAFAGGGITIAAGAISATDAALAAAGGIAMATGDLMRKGGSGSSGGGGEPTTPQQMQRQIDTRQAPAQAERVDSGRMFPNGRWEPPHVHFKDGSALTQDGLWRHGSSKLTKAVIQWLTSNGWKVPK
jgi:hypothetical protein